MKQIIYSFKRLGGQRSVSAVGQGQPEEIKKGSTDWTSVEPADISQVNYIKNSVDCEVKKLEKQRRKNNVS